MRSLKLPVILLCTAFFVLAEAAESEGTVCQKKVVGNHICPELYFLGAQKSGSSSLFVWLRDRYKEEIYVANLTSWHRKEPHFFDFHFDKGIDYYASLFPVRSNMSELAVDATPDYYRIFPVLERMYENLPIRNLRFVVSFRDPVARAYSWYGHILTEFMKPGSTFELGLRAFDSKFSLMAGFVPLHISNCLEDVESPYEAFESCSGGHFYGYRGIVPATGKTTQAFGTPVSLFWDGMYGYIMLHWLKVYDAEQFCLIIYEQLIEDFYKEMQYVKPCMKHFDFDLRVKEGDRFPSANGAHCSDCGKELFSDSEFREIGHALHENLYKPSNELFRSLLSLNYNRSNLTNWEDLYLEQDSQDA